MVQAEQYGSKEGSKAITGGEEISRADSVAVLRERTVSASGDCAGWEFHSSTWMRCADRRTGRKTFKGHGKLPLQPVITHCFSYSQAKGRKSGRLA